MLVPALLLTDCMLRELLAQHLLLEMRRMQMLGLTLILAFVVKDVGGHLENATAIDPGLVGRCSDGESAEVVGVTKEELEMQGNCVPYMTTPGGGLCDSVYEAGVDYVYVPFTRLNGNLTAVASILQHFVIFIDILAEECKPIVLHALMCFYYLPPCGNSTHFVPPPAICHDECLAASEVLCPDEFNGYTSFVEDISSTDFEALGFNVVNCSNPGQYINPLPHCCYTVTEPPPATDEPSGSEGDSENTPVIAAVVTCVGVAVAIAVCVVIVVVILLLRRRRNYQLKSRSPVEHNHGFQQRAIMLGDRQTSERYFELQHQKASFRTVASSEGLELLKSNNMAIPGGAIELIDTVGKGEFGVVYRARLTQRLGKMVKGDIVAVKTLKGSIFGSANVDEMIQEAIKMKGFDHPNVLGLIGVSIDVGEAPYIVMPFMANGSLLSYLKRERANLSTAEEAGEQLIEESQKHLLSMCLQIARGMEYLAQRRFVHRDLATRNCMIDDKFVIKVADFGLSEDVYMKNYFRQGETESVQLPIKWMAIESLHDGLFSEKSDVWSFGVTCWEVFSLGRSPYPAVDPFTLIAYLDRGERLTKPNNAACSPEIYEKLQQCWKKEPDERPSFKDLVQSFSTMLEKLAGYMDLSILTSLRDN